MATSRDRSGIGASLIAIAGLSSMSVPDPEFQALLRQIRTGSQEAAWQLIERYGPHIHRVVRRNLDRRLRSQFDSLDFVQAVWASFFRDPSTIHSFHSPDEIIGYLAATARNKVIDEARRRLGTQKHDVRRTRSLNDHECERGQLASRQPTPSDIAIAREQWNRLMDRQPFHYQEVVRLRFMGATSREIAVELKINERTVRKIVERLLQLEVV